MATRLKENYLAEAVPALQQKFGYKNVMMIPRLEKIVINMGLGDCKDNAKALETARFKTPLGESAMRADDHQILLPIAVSKVSKDAKFKADNTPMGFQTVKLFSAQEAAAPVQGNCKMQRPG